MVCHAGEAVNDDDDESEREGQKKKNDGERWLWEISAPLAKVVTTTKFLFYLLTWR